ncbi:DUF2726 domain-containing protein [Nitrospira sp. Kam-Ns4a]
MIVLALAALGLTLLGLVAWFRIRKRLPAGARPTAARSPIPDGVVLDPQPLLSPPEATFYNVLRLAVQDRYLVLAQVPLWCLAEVKAADAAQRRAFLSTLAFKRLDFALVHPGTLLVEKVIDLDDPEAATPQRQARAKLIDELCRAIGVEAVRLNGATTYTPAALATALGLEPEE